jgi:hypothetical protein
LPESFLEEIQKEIRKEEELPPSPTPPVMASSGYIGLYLDGVGIGVHGWPETR